MPRGYLKRYQKEVGHKNARGGSSRKNTSDQTASLCRGFHQDHFPERDFAVRQTRKTSNQQIEVKKEGKIMYPTAECPICFEEGPVIPINSGNGSVAGCCSWHDAACFNCLRRMYVTDAQKDASNYPLRCYHPQCQSRVNWGQLHKHKLICSQEENDAYHKMMHKARNDKIVAALHEKLDRQVLARKGDALRISCPYCNCPKLCDKKYIMSTVRDKILDCKLCKKQYYVSPNYAIIAAIERSVEQRKTDNDGGFHEGVARCPSCGILISKGYVCDHMQCFCGRHFSWHEAKANILNVPHAKVPYEQLHLWW
mmetsp:Transcript_7148/g.10436  ORF Transcript_7148/g.10436 Transcript_7148/m.10436 type:complete len:311 (-) Transcript_7148:89-1021(-)